MNTAIDERSVLRRKWLHNPRDLRLRRTVFLVHLWGGIVAGLYLVVICVSGSVLVYRDELFEAATPVPIMSAALVPRLTDAQLEQAALRQYPGYRVTNILRPDNRRQAVDVSLIRDGREISRLFDPDTGTDLGNVVPLAISIVAGLVDLHDNLLASHTGRLVNGVGAMALTLLGVSGIAVWWPGIGSWRRGLTVRRGVGWKRFIWDVHGAIGIWAVAFVLLFGITGVYLSFSAELAELIDYFEPPTYANLGHRFGDRAAFLLAYLHFGRFGGWQTRVPWAVAGFAPVALALTGATMWWNRVVRRRTF